MSCLVKHSVRRILRPWIFASLAASVIGGQAMAADPGAATTPQPAAGTPADSGGLQEVIVTAQFQSQNVQQTPLAITAVNAEALAARGQTSLTELSQDAPSVQLQQTSAAFGPSMSAFIRGIGQSLPILLMSIGQAEATSAALITQCSPANAGPAARRPITSNPTN